MPSLEHEAPLVVLREAPALVPALLHEVLGVALPAYQRVELDDADLSEVLPTERRADLVVRLAAASSGGRPAMGVIVEVQRARDADKRWTWPAYAAALHARLRCRICLLVLAADERTARWAARPIMSLQHGSPFVPLVIGPSRMPRLSSERARHEPWLAILSGLCHGNRPQGAGAVRAVAAALEVLPGEPASLCYDLVCAALNKAARRLLEEEMLSGKYEYRSDFARRYYGEGARDVVLALVDRHGAVRDELRARLATVRSAQRLRDLAVDLAAAPDRETIEDLLTALVPPADG